MPSVYHGLVRAPRARATRLQQQVGQSAGFNIDTMLSPVLGAFGVDDVSQLPAAVASKYDEVKQQLTNIPGMQPEQLASAMGPAIVNGVVDFAQGNGAAAAKMVYASMEAVMATAGGPIGAAVAAGIDATQDIMRAIGGTAHGAGDQCDQCRANGAIWYGAWNIAQHKAPATDVLADGSPDPRWVRWDNKTTRGPLVVGSDGNNDGQCADDLPTVDMSASGINRWTCGGTVSGQFLDLPYMMNGLYVAKPSGPFAFLPGASPMPVPEGTPGAAFITPYAPDSFDFAFAQQLTLLLEQYMNKPGPAPVVSSSQQVGPNQWISIPNGPSEINLRNVAESMLAGWNVTHQPGKRIQINRPWPTYTPPVTYTGPNNTGFKSGGSPVAQITTLWDPQRQPGDYVRRFILGDTRAQDVPLYLNTGPLLQSIQELFAMLPKSSGGLIHTSYKPGSSAPGFTLPSASAYAGYHSPAPPAHLAAMSLAMKSSPALAAMAMQPAAAVAVRTTKPSYVGLGTLVGVSGALTLGFPAAALGVLGVGAVAGYIEAIRELSSPPPPAHAPATKPSYVGLGAVMGLGGALAFGVPLVALGVLAVGAVAGYVQALREL